MTRSVEIPDAAVEAAAKAVSLDWRNYTDSMRVALVAARPYLMPTREAIAEAMHNHWSETHLWRQGCREDVCIGIFLDRAAAIEALLSGES